MLRKKWLEETQDIKVLNHVHYVSVIIYEYYGKQQSLTMFRRDICQTFDNNVDDGIQSVSSIY